MQNEQTQNLNTNLPPTQPAPEPVIQASSEQSTEHKSKLSKWIIAVVVLVLIVVGGASAYLLNKNSASEIQEQAAKTTPSPASNAVDATSTWKTYNFSSEGINFKLPSTWNEYTFSGASHPEKAHYFASSNPKNSDPKKESIEFGYLTRNLTYEELVNFYKANNAVNFPINEKLFIDGRECLFTASTKPLGQGSLASGIDTYLYAADCASKNNKQYTFSFSSRNQKDDQLFKIILSTLKFTDQTSQTPTDETANGKTYTSLNGKYQFQYSKDVSISEEKQLRTDLFENYTYIKKDNQTLATIIFYTPSNTYPTLDDFAKGERLDSNQAKEIISVANSTAYKFKLNPYGNPGPVVVTKLNNQYIEFMNQGFQNFDQILSSFKSN